MKQRLAIAAVVLQVLVLAFMAGQREWILHFGRTVWLRTAPIDPNDPMRGDYARLDYEIAHVSTKLLEGGLPQKLAAAQHRPRETNHRVYARLDVGEDGIARLAGLSDAKPADGLFIRGEREDSGGSALQVRYGIEAFFMKQGTARQLENMRASERPGVPLDMEVAISSSGTAVLKGYRWESLGISLKFERATDPAPENSNTPAGSTARQPFIKSVEVELKNHGPEEVAIVDLPDGGSFRLLPNDRWSEAPYRWVGETRPAPPVAAANVIVLKPGQAHRTRIDLTQPAWFVVKTTPASDSQPKAFRDLANSWDASFRIEYAPPSKTSTAGLPHADLIQYERLQSRAFNASAGVD